MKTLNLDTLINTPKETIVKDVNQIFSNLLNEIQNYLGLEAINPNIIISITSDQKKYSEDFFSLGVRRTIVNDYIQIEISEKCLKFFEFILLREVYLIFVPYELRENKIIQIVIHEIIESDLSKQGAITEWKALVRSNIINYEFLSSQFDKLDKFFKLEAPEKTQNPTQFFFEFIRRNISVIHDKMDDFYDILYEEFIYKSSKSLYNDEIIETIRVLIKIFYQVKIFKNYTEFEDYFQDFKDKGIITTNLSKRKFSENLRWINKSTIISPSFQPIYHKINVSMLTCILKFNPILNRKDINNILTKIPFLHFHVFAKNGFSEEILCYFVIPKIYQKDLLKLIENLNSSGYITNKECYILKDHNNILNLNYFREYFKDLSKIVNPNHKFYDNRYEIICSGSYGEPKKIINLSLLDWLIFERVGEISLVGFGFERRVDILQSLKEELLNHLKSERILISNLRTSLNFFYDSLELKKALLEFLDNEQRFGFFYVDNMLGQILKYLDLVEKIISKNRIKTLIKLQEFFKFPQISHLIEENIFFRYKEIRLIVFRDFIPLYFKARREYLILKQKYNQFHNFFQSCRKLKIFSIESMKQIVKNEKLPEKIYYTKEKKLKQSFEKFKPYKITIQTLNTIFDRFVDKGLINPELIDTIITSSFAKYHPILILKDTLKVNTQLDKLTRMFPRVFLDKVKNLFNSKPYIIVFLYFLNIKEKSLFCSILYNTLGKELIILRRYFTSGLVPSVVIKDFYDFNKNEFHYSKDLFEQSFLYIKQVLGDSKYPLQKIKTDYQERLWSTQKSMDILEKEVEKRVSYESSEFKIDRINELIEFQDNLNAILPNPEKFKSIQNTGFFKTYVKAIKFIPNFHAFKLDQYVLYIHPSNVDEIDFKHLLINSFQSIKYPSIIENTNSFLIKYIFPYNNPNKKHLNWYTKTKRIVQEYCLFSIRHIYQILNFNYNLNPDGWNYDSNRFKIYMQNILFDPEYKVEFSNIRQFKMMKSKEANYAEPNSVYFKALSEIYKRRSIDIKSFLGTQKYSIIKNITELLNKNLVFPYISLKNLDFQDKIYIILPNIKLELNQIILKIFNFFNYGFVYKIEGEYFIYGFNREIKFENGIMIKLFFPQCEIDEFLRLFDSLFEYLEINNYIVLTDLTNGKNLLKAIYGNLKFLDSYNPFINLNWNDKDKIWMNHKLFTEKFEKIYPDL